MAFVTDDEAERIAGYRQQQGLASKPAPQPDPFQNWQDPVDFAPPAVAPYKPPVSLQNTWQDFGEGQGGYVEEGTGNVWSNGLWYDPDNGAVWNEPAGTWQQPQQYNDYWGAIQQHDVGFQNLFDSQPPEGAMATAPDFNEWWRKFDRNNGLAPTGEFPQSYSLGFDTSALGEGPVQWNGPSDMSRGFNPYSPMGWEDDSAQTEQVIPQFGDLGWATASLQETGGVFADRTQRLPGVIEGLGGMFGLGGRAGGLPETSQLAEIYQEDVLPNVSGNEFIRKFTPFKPENLPGPLPYLTDALAPINFATAAIAPSVPVLGAMFKGPYVGNLAAEMGIDIGARFGAEQAAGERGASVPLFGEQPAWLRGLEGGLLGGLGAAGAIKGVDAGLPALGRYLDEPIEVAPGEFVKRGEFGGGKFGPVEPEPKGVLSGGVDEVVRQRVGRVKAAEEGTYPRLTDWAVTDADNWLDENPTLIRRLRGLGPDQSVTVYRAVDPSDPATTLRPGDWVAIRREYAQLHGELGDSGARLISQKVPANDLAFPGTSVEEWVYAPRGIAPEPPKLAVDAGPTIAKPGVDVPFPGQRAILDALQEQIRFRESGEAEALIRAGRATQATGLGEALAKGGTLDELLQSGGAGMRVGSMLGEGTPLSLSDDAIQAATKEIVDSGLASGRNFDTYGTLKALKKLQDGEWLQPGEIKKLGKVFGSDVEDAIRKTNNGRIKITADLTPEDITRIDRLAEVEGEKAARAEIEAQAQHKLADDLAKRARMDPTNKRLASAVDDARARALKLDADAERFQVERIEKMEAQARAKTQRAETAANREEVRQAEMRDRRELKGQATQEYTESGAKALDKALATIDKADLPDSVKATAKEAVEQWVKADGAILDSMKGDAPGFMRVVYAGAVGEVSDSWTSALLEQRAFMRGVLQDMGFDAKTSDAIAKALSDMEVTRRWGPEPPPHIAKSLDQAKRKFGMADNAITGMAQISQEFKNIMFGIADVGIFGIQGLAAGAQGLAPMLAGTVNRVLNVARLGVDTSPGNLAKRVQYGLDGRVRGGATYTGAVDQSAGTLLRHIPGLRTIDQKYISRYIGAVNDIQFRHVMGFLGDLIHEGQLAMLKVTGSDITDPLVRKQSAEFANAISSAGKLSQRAGRGNVERGFILSASMVRAQAQVLGKLGRLLGPTTTRENRIMAASILVSYGATLAAVGKYLNDAIGTDDFEFDPSKPGAWQIRLSSGRMVNLFPQTQLFKLLAQSARVIAEEGQGEQDAERIGKAWLNFGIGRLSPAASIGSSASGVGFDPESGWRYGDLNEGKSWWEQMRDNVLPVPPLVDSTLREGLDALGTPLDAFGVSNYQESEWSAREREIKADPRFQGRGWNELEEKEKAIVNAEGGRVYSRDPQIKAQQERADVIAGDAKAYQEKIDQWQLRGEKPDGTPYTVDDWKRDRAKNDRFVAGRYEELYAGVDWKKDDLNPVDLYYKAIADAVDPKTDEVNWDKVDAWKATLSTEDLAYIERNTNLRDTNLEQQWRQDVKLLSDSGYFDAENKVAVRKADPEIAQAVRRWGYSEMSVKAEDTVLRYTAQQEVDDRSLQQGDITREQWRENYNQRRDQLRAEKDGIYAGMKDDGVSTDPIDAYFKEIGKAVGPNGIDIDWDRVDAWVAQQPADVQASINSYASPGLTPVVDQYKADVEKVADSGYFDRSKQNWAKVVEAYGTEGVTELAAYASYEDWRKAAAAEILQAPEAKAWIAQNNPSPEYIDRIVQDALNDEGPAKGMEYFNGDWRDQWVLNDPQAAYTAWKWGWWTPTNAISEWLSQQYSEGRVR